ncbi:GDSL esterase/lipase [Thalictrum thalictroides]|uniref:GDSL esterase/lipase n=1 Tax=Thalictrum thalictroides TaxID=46969 RepID=A0A7J6XBD4_THATH|nr:GDSL esterase/lipase [Thalictrum thalictroides]
MEYSFIAIFGIVFISFVSVPCPYVHCQITNNAAVSAILVFGDSTVDPGNNNYIPTILKANFPPYGTDMPNHESTGRFCNGRLTTDFIASYLKIKDYVPPFLDRSLSIEELKTGVSFASAGSGYDPLTPQESNVIPVQQQLEFFKQYKAKLESAMGTAQMESHIQNAVFVISCGTNDLAANYFISPVRRGQYSIAQYQNLMLQNAKTFLQGLLSLGARKIGIVGLPPIGCLPFLLTLNNQQECIESFSTAAKQYNQMFQVELKNIQNANPGVVLAYADIYEPLQHIIQTYKESGYDERSRGCCGTGLLEVSYLCNHLAPLCPDRSKYIFWDAIHPTEKVYESLFTSLRSVIDSVIKA